MISSSPIYTSARSIERVLGAGLPVLLVIERRGCPPCAQLLPILDLLAADYAGRALVARVDAPDNLGLLQRFGVSQLPGLVFVREGRVVAQASGAASEEALRAWMDYLTAGGPRPPLPEGPAAPISARAAQVPASPSGRRAVP